MAKECLDVADIRAILKEVRCEGMSKTMYRYLFIDTCVFASLIENRLEAPYGERPAVGAFEEPDLRMV